MAPASVTGCFSWTANRDVISLVFGFLRLIVVFQSNARSNTGPNTSSIIVDCRAAASITPVTALLLLVLLLVLVWLLLCVGVFAWPHYF
jgi:hypothetical protein